MNSLTAFFAATLTMLRGRLDSKDQGATMVEYGLLVALIAVVVIAALLVLGPAISGLFNGIVGNL